MKTESSFHRTPNPPVGVGQRKVFNDYKKIAKGLAEFLGPSCEVVLHNFRNLKRSIVALEGNVTGRSVGGPVTELLLHLIKSGKTRENIINLKTTTSSGKPLKSAIFFIHDGAGKAIGAFCINYDLSSSLMFKHALDQFVDGVPWQEPEGSVRRQGEKSKKTVYGHDPFGKDVEDTLGEIMRDAMELVGKPVHMMKKEDKFLVTRHAEERGVFLLKGAAGQIADILKVSPYTIYNYLRVIRNSK